MTPLEFVRYCPGYGISWQQDSEGVRSITVTLPEIYGRGVISATASTEEEAAVILLRKIGEAEISSTWRGWVRHFLSCF